MTALYTLVWGYDVQKVTPVLFKYLESFTTISKRFLCFHHLHFNTGNIWRTV